MCVGGYRSPHLIGVLFISKGLNQILAMVANVAYLDEFIIVYYTVVSYSPAQITCTEDIDILVNVTGCAGSCIVIRLYTIRVTSHANIQHSRYLVKSGAKMWEMDVSRNSSSKWACDQCAVTFQCLLLAALLWMLLIK